MTQLEDPPARAMRVYTAGTEEPATPTALPPATVVAAPPPPILPPPGPMRVYGKPRRSRGRRTLKVIGIVLLVLLVLAAAGAGIAYWWTQKQVSTFQSPQNAAQADAQGEVVAPSSTPGAPFNVLLLGYDIRGSETGNGLSDTLILVHIDPRKKTLATLSLPRDLMVQVPGHGLQQINWAYSQGGEKLALQTVKALTGVPINYLVPVNFKAFVKLVDAFNGVYLTVDQRYFNQNDGSAATDYSSIDLQPGFQKLSGRQALAFARFRHLDSDVMRNARQQAFLREFRSRIDIWGAATRGLQLVNTIESYIRFIPAKGHKLSTDHLFQLSRDISAIPPSNSVTIRLRTSAYPFDPNRLVASDADVRTAVAALLHPNPKAGTEATTKELGPAGAGKAKKTRKAPYTKASFSIEVRNGTTTAGAAAVAAQKLQDAGWKAAQPAGNADRPSYARSTVYYDRGVPAARSVAADLAASAGVSGRLRALTPAIRRSLGSAGRQAVGALVVLVVGPDFTGAAAGGASATGSSSSASGTPSGLGSLATDATRDRPLYQQLAASSKLRLQMPTAMPGNVRPGDHNHPTSQPAGRSYTINGKRAVEVEYYAPADASTSQFVVQAVGWDLQKVPILRSPTSERTLAGVTYRLFYNGSQLHRVAWEAGGVTYWIENSLVDYLPNATMIAIARSFRPVGRT